MEDPYAPPAVPPSLPPATPTAGRLGDDAGMRLLLPVGRSGLAIAAGYLGLFSLVLVPAPIALIVSILAIRDIQRSKLSAHEKHGLGRAVFGLVMGLLGTLLLAVISFSILMHG